MPVSKDKPQEYGDGGLYRRADGLWVGTVEAGWTTKGKRRRVYVYAKTEAKARRKQRDKKLQVRDGAAQASARATVKTWAAEWLPIVERTLAPNAYNSTRTAVDRWIVPTIGRKRFDALTPADVRAVADAQRDAGRKSSTQRRTHSTLMQLLKAASFEGYPVPQRLLTMKAPAISISDRTDMSVPEAVAVLEQAARLPYGSRFVAAFLQGMRQAECSGLTWPEVDLDGNSLTISWQLQTLRYKHGCDPSTPTCGKRAASCPRRTFRVPDGYEARQVKGALHLVRPKSDQGWRVLPLVPWMRSSLEAWRELAPENPHQLVWLTADDSPRYYKDDDAEWYALQEAAGVRHPTGRLYTIHEARHTTAQLLMEARVDPAVVTAILGHSSIVTSRGYMHAKQTHTLDALEQVAERLQLGVTPQPGAPGRTA